ncbi:MAG: FAD-dependent oxidoreductase [Gemmatimonadota bacterium]|nr:FAD-dependent oxidoreductase [Gemmatimonadota bacterium]
MTARPDSAPDPLRVAVIGAGPAGLFTADALRRRDDLEARIDVFDRWPAPYGLVRDGVAPDHPSIKSVTRVFDAVLSDPRVRFLGNVRFGADLGRDDLLRFYDQVIYAVGAQADRRLGIPGEDLRGSHAATDFVRWYNGHPERADFAFDLSAGRAVVIGNGNVALDVARILVTDPAVLAATDIADHALAALQASRVREVVLVGRRGPAEARFTNVELKEMGRLEGVEPVVHGGPQLVAEAARAAGAAADDRRVARNLGILADFAARPPAGAPRRVVFRFLASPVEIQGRDGRAAGVRLEWNRLEPGPGGAPRAVGTGETETLEAGLVLRSVGYRGVPLPGLPFDERRGTVPNAAGRVLEEPGGAVRPREYVAGWIKRGPGGIIGTNKACGAETAAAMAADAAAGGRAAPVRDPAALEDFLAARCPYRVTFEDWRRIDAAETERGAREGRPRVKFVRVEEMLRVLED